jgi:hypothetical protein
MAVFSLIGYMEKDSSFPIRVVNFFETFCTYLPNSLKQDLIVKIAKIIYIFSFGLLELEMAVLRFFLRKKAFVF